MWLLMFDAFVCHQQNYEACIRPNSQTRVGSFADFVDVGIQADRARDRHFNL